jgi:hypothetical protein
LIKAEGKVVSDGKNQGLIKADAELAEGKVVMEKISHM